MTQKSYIFLFIVFGPPGDLEFVCNFVYELFLSMLCRARRAHSAAKRPMYSQPAGKELPNWLHLGPCARLRSGGMSPRRRRTFATRTHTTWDSPLSRNRTGSRGAPKPLSRCRRASPGGRRHRTCTSVPERAKTYTIHAPRCYSRKPAGREYSGARCVTALASSKGLASRDVRPSDTAPARRTRPRPTHMLSGAHAFRPPTRKKLLGLAQDHALLLLNSYPFAPHTGWSAMRPPALRGRCLVSHRPARPQQEPPSRRTIARVAPTMQPMETQLEPSCQRCNTDLLHGAQHAVDTRPALRNLPCYR